MSEDAVVASFLSSVGPGGWMRELLVLGELGVVLGDTLFVHGGLMGNYRDGARESFGFVPSGGGRGATHRQYANVAVWIRQLNRWKAQQVSAALSWPERAPGLA